MRSLHYNLIAALHSVDSIVQLAKHEGASVEMLQNLARIARGQLYTMAEQVKREQGDLSAWRFGQMVESHADIALEPPKRDEETNKR